MEVLIIITISLSIWSREIYQPYDYILESQVQMEWRSKIGGDDRDWQPSLNIGR